MANDNKVINIIYYIYAMLMLGIISICIIFQRLEYQRKNYENISDLVLLFLGIFCVLFIYVLLRMFENKRLITKQTKIVFFIFSVVLLVFQIYAISSYYFYTDWDVSIIIEIAKANALGKTIDLQEYYFSRYPNNVFIAFLFSKIMCLFYKIGMGEFAYFACILFQCLISWIVGLELFGVVRKITDCYAISFSAYILYLILGQFSPWISIPYSDGIGLFFPMTVVWIYFWNVNGNKKQFVKWFIIAFISYCGYCIKPQTLIVTIALSVIELITLLYNIKSKLKKFVKLSIAFVIGCAVSFIIITACENSFNDNVKIDDERTFGVAHFLMMGANSECQGVWNQEDYNFSDSYLTVKERNLADIRVFKQRLNEMGLCGVAKHICKKTLVNYNDGTFCWGGEGNFYVELVDNKDNFVTSLFRNLYYNRNQMGKHYKYWSNIEEMLWITVLFMSIAVLGTKKNKKIAVLALSIIGLTIFELLFEARARYLFTYIPIYILLGILGLDACVNKLYNKYRKFHGCDGRNDDKE